MKAKLTATFCKGVKSDGVDRIFWDDQLRGFAFRVRAKGGKSFYAEGRVGGGRAAPKRSKTWPYGTFTVDRARREAGVFLRALANGVDPMAEEAKAAADAEASRLATEKAAKRAFEVVMEDYLTKKVRGRLVRAKQDEGQLRLHFLPEWEGKDIASITRSDVRDLLESLEEDGRPGAARKARAVVSALFSWAMDQDLIPANPAAGRGLLNTTYAPRERVLTDSELTEAWAAASALGYPFGPLVHFLVLTGQRRDEVSGARWEEFDLAAGVWEIPPQRTKNKRPHLVHLSPLAKGLIEALPRISITHECGKVEPSPFLFTTTGHTPVSGFSRAKLALDTAIANARQEACEDGEAQPMPHWTLHDFRRTMVSGCGALGIDLHVAERCVNHVPTALKGVARVYQRHEFLPERKAAILAWSRHVEERHNKSIRKNLHHSVAETND